MRIRETSKFWVFGFREMDFPSHDGGQSWQRGPGEVYVDKSEWASTAAYHGWGRIAKPTDSDPEYDNLGHRLFDACVPSRFAHV